MTKVLLYSGGVDSWLISKIWNPDILLYVNIGGSYSESEISRLPREAKIVDFDFLGSAEQENKYVPMRNLYFLMIASHFGNEIVLGATAGDGGADKSVSFLKEAEKIISFLWRDKKCAKEVAIETKFAEMSKEELLDEYLKSGGSVDDVKTKTFSCYEPEDGKECFSCYPCFRKFALLSSRGAVYSKEERRRIWEYVKRFVIPTKEQGGYDGTYYTDRGSESEALVFAVERLKNEFE